MMGVQKTDIINIEKDLRGVERTLDLIEKGCFIITVQPEDATTAMHAVPGRLLTQALDMNRSEE